ncbi:MAG: hypothetical protein RAK17_02545 [Caldisphaera sp.]|nr:hypothetical protein [Caldisphaera sp.]
MKKVRIILNGSEMGIVYEFLKNEDPDSSLYGSAFSTIEIKSLLIERNNTFS